YVSKILESHPRDGTQFSFVLVVVCSKKTVSQCHIVQLKLLAHKCPCFVPKASRKVQNIFKSLVLGHMYTFNRGNSARDLLWIPSTERLFELHDMAFICRPMASAVLLHGPTITDALVSMDLRNIKSIPLQSALLSLRLCSFHPRILAIYTTTLLR